MKLLAAWTLACLLVTSCRSQPETARRPAEPGALDSVEADPAARDVALRVVAGLGGRDAWDDTRYVSWRFMGKRRHVWDKWTGDLRLEDKDRVYLVNVHTGRGRVFVAGLELDDPVALAQAIETARAIWINDSYWMFMPYKLLDPGVRLAHDGVEKLPDGRDADVLSLTFENVGLTPENRYRVFVARDTGRVEAWSWFEKASDAEPRFTLPWSGWKRFGEIWLATEHGQPADWDIAVHADLPREVFESPAPVKL